MLKFGLLDGQNKHCEGVSSGNCDSISHYFLIFYKPNNQSINAENNQQINPEWK